MKQLFQNSPEHNEKIRQFGCKYITALNFYQDITGIQLSSELVNAVYVQSQRSYTVDDNGKKTYYMDKDCFVYNISGIIQLVSGYTGVDVHMKQVHRDEGYNFKMGYFTRTTNGGKFVGHFTGLELNSDTVTDDPWLGGSKTARIGKLSSYRFIKARLL